MKKQIVLFLMALLPVVGWAEEAEINGLWFELVSRAKEAKVIQYKNNVMYSGNIVIPATVEYEGVEYSVTSLGERAFSNCRSLTSITIPNSVTSIGENAFSSCRSLTSITIPNSVTSIGKNAFSSCSGLTSVNIPNSVSNIAACVFWGCTGLTSITIPNSITLIGNGAFAGCTGLTSITIPNSVITIVPEAFIRCGSLTSVIIGSGVEEIGFNAFAQCFNLTDVYCYAENVPKTHKDAFIDSYINHSTLHVPTSAINSYRETEPWSGFGTIVTLDGEEPTVEQCATPKIYYQNGKLSFKSATEGAQFVSEITDADVKKNYTAEVDLSVTYTISVYATKDGYTDSEVATATLCWIDVDPQKEGITELDEDVVPGVKAIPVLMQFEGSSLVVSGAKEGTPISIYDLSGHLLGSTTATNGTTRVLASNNEKVVIVKVGERTVKVAK